MKWTPLSPPFHLNGRLRATCRCVCGRVADLNCFRDGTPWSQSCRSCAGKPTTHGAYRTPEYNAWRQMKARCSNKNHPHWKDYGKRGIKVCRRWTKSFPKFLEDMGLRPSPAHSIERKDNNKSYCKDNCVWATIAQQRANTRATVRVTFNGETMHLAAWTRRRGYPLDTISRRLLAGWSVEDALTKPLSVRKKKLSTAVSEVAGSG